MLLKDHEREQLKKELEPFLNEKKLRYRIEYDRRNLGIVE